MEPLAVAGDNESGLPTRGSPSGRHARQVDVQPCANEQPGGGRVGVPHLSGLALVSSPDECRHVGDQVQHALREERIVRQPLWAFDGRTNVGYHSVAPAPNLVSEDPESARPTASNRAFSHAPLARVVPPARALLDHKTTPPCPHHKRRVVQVASRPPLKPYHHCLEHTPVPPHRVVARADGSQYRSTPYCGSALVIGLVQPARVQLALLDPQGACQKEEWPLGTATQGGRTGRIGYPGSRGNRRSSRPPFGYALLTLDRRNSQRPIMRRDDRAHVAPSTAARSRSAALATMARCSRGSRALRTGARFRRYSASTYLACRRPWRVASPPPTHRIFTARVR